jgi:hypothetical protein
MVGIRSGLVKLIEEGVQGGRLLVATDSQSSLSPLKVGPLNQDCALNVEVWNLLYTLLELRFDITFQFVYSHCGTVRNDAADAFVDRSLPSLCESQSDASIPYAAIKSEIKCKAKSTFKESLGPLLHPVNLKTMKQLSRSDQALAARLRTGQHPKIGKMHWKYLKLSEGSMCRCCNLVEETILHIFNDCQDPEVTMLRNEFNFKDRQVLYKDPKAGIEFIKKLANKKRWLL